MAKRKKKPAPAPDPEWMSWEDWWKDYQLALEAAETKRQRRISDLKRGVIPLPQAFTHEANDGNQA